MFSAPPRATWRTCVCVSRWSFAGRDLGERVVRRVGHRACAWRSVSVPARAWRARSSRSTTSVWWSATTASRSSAGMPRRREARAGRRLRPLRERVGGRLLAQDAVAEVEELEQVEAERDVRCAVRPVPRVQAAVGLGEVPLDPVAVPASERELGVAVLARDGRRGAGRARAPVRTTRSRRSRPRRASRATP